MKRDNIEIQRKTLELMISVYCKGQKHDSPICPSCKALLEYSNKRLDACRYGINKPACSKCKIHCYKPEMREKIKQVMRYSGPRMLYKHPILSIKHQFWN
ncbi:MAG: nitrous oxide-stimulated promoter family protein [Firmicutes bacterium]|nr:nitrous oxide-stimulated promoter family protein [Bacillota bacterium]